MKPDDSLTRFILEGVNVRGPFPADTLFVRAVRGEFDVVIAAYHDQGLVPVKLDGTVRTRSHASYS